MTEKQILSPQQICSGCLLADRRGYPRWHQGKLGCGQELCQPQEQPPLYECQMGFLIADVESSEQ